MDKSQHHRDTPGVAFLPLRGKTVLLTRPRMQSEDMTRQLEAVGATVVHCPTIEVLPPHSWVQLDASIRRIKEYDWVVFTSTNGVRFFFDRLGEIEIEGAEALAGRVVCAIGPVTAKALEQAGVVAQVTASDSRAEGALRAIIDHLGGEQNVRGLQFLIPRAKVAREILPAGLRKLGARVDAVEAYQTVKPEIARESILRLFRETSIDVVTFTSSSTVSKFAALVGMTDLSDLLGNILVACIGPITAETAASYELKNIIQPKLYNAEALVESIVMSIGQE
jgi:uroporphyrinogen III methyltransferase / synthase